MFFSSVTPDMRGTPWRAVYAAMEHQQAQVDDIVAAFVLFIGAIVYTSKGNFWDRADPYRYKLFEKPQQLTNGSNAVERISHLEELLDAGDFEVAIMWASQSGTAERMAERLSRDLRRRFRAKSVALDISTVTPASFEDVSAKRLVIFIASTFGEGDPSDNMHQMWSWLRTKSKTSLSNLRFLAFGLGNSNYKHYNHVIDVIEEELLARDAKMLLKTGKADDVAGQTEEHFLDWKQRLFELFETTLGYERQTQQYQPSLEVSDALDARPSDFWLGQPHTSILKRTQPLPTTLAILQSYDLLHQSTDRKCLHMEFDISHDRLLKYKTGDHLAIWPINPAQEVSILLEALGLEGRRQTRIRIKSLEDVAAPIPSPTTIEIAFRSYLEVCAPVSRETVGDLVAYAPNAAAADFLRTLSQDQTAYTNYSKLGYLNMGRLLTAACSSPAAWSSLPLSLLLETLPAMQPRLYSISSSSIVHPRKVSITVAISDTTTSQCPERVVGLATNYLLSTKAGNHHEDSTAPTTAHSGQVYAAVRRSSFKLPASPAAPILMVGAGTGVSPFRAFVQERARLKSMGRMVGKTRLFFGCRHPSQDCLYAAEFDDWKRTLDNNFSMTTAFSRADKREDRHYVQDTIVHAAEEVYQLLVEENAYFYICGSAAMARDVSAAIAQILKESKHWDDEEVKRFADQQKRQRRWFQDVWG